MKLKSLLLACFILMSAVSISAQSSGAAADPLSGAWTGDMDRTRPRGFHSK